MVNSSLSNYYIDHAYYRERCKPILGKVARLIISVTISINLEEMTTEIRITTNYINIIVNCEREDNKCQ